MGWFAPRSPVAEDEQVWIEDSFAWLVAEFGEDVVRRPVAEPTLEHFPIRYASGGLSAHRATCLVATRMDVLLTRVELEYVAAEPEGGRRWQHAYRGPAGHYHEHEGKSVVTVYGDQTTEPTTLFVLAHREFHSLMDQSAEVRRCVFDAMAKRIRTHEEMSAL